MRRSELRLQSETKMEKRERADAREFKNVFILCVETGGGMVGAKGCIGKKESGSAATKIRAFSSLTMSWSLIIYQIFS